MLPAISGLVEIKVGNAPGLSTLRFTNLTYNVYLPENSPTGTPVTTVTARFTSGASGAITYSFTSSNEDDTFNIHPTTGELLSYIYSEHRVTDQTAVCLVCQSISAVYWAHFSHCPTFHFWQILTCAL